MTILMISDAMAPAIGDIRAAGKGDTILVRQASTERRDWPTYWAAVGTAWRRGAVVSLMNREES